MRPQSKRTRTLLVALVLGAGLVAWHQERWSSAPVDPGVVSPGESSASSSIDASFSSEGPRLPVAGGLASRSNDAPAPWIRPAGDVVGEVVDPDGRPASAFTALLFRPRAEGGLERVASAHGTAGRFVLRGVEAGSYLLRVERYGQGSEPRRLVVTDGAVRVDDSAPPIQLRAHASVSGRVLGSGGRPVEDARVWIGGRSARTTATGRFRIRGLSRGEVTVSAVAPTGARTQRLELLLESGDSVEDLELRLIALEDT